MWAKYLSKTLKGFLFREIKNKHARNQKPETRNQKPRTKKPRNRFHFQVWESPAPLNIPTPTPAPNRGGPVACMACMAIL